VIAAAIISQDLFVDAGGSSRRREVISYNQKRRIHDGSSGIVRILAFAVTFVSGMMARGLRQTNLVAFELAVATSRTSRATALSTRFVMGLHLSELRIRSHVRRSTRVRITCLELVDRRE
jgi:hypothetical protein